MLWSAFPEGLESDKMSRAGFAFLCDATPEPARDGWSLPALTVTLKGPSRPPGDLGRVGVAAGASAQSGGSGVGGQGVQRVGCAGTTFPVESPQLQGCCFVPLLPGTDTVREQPPHVHELLFTAAMVSSGDTPTTHQPCQR